jgi:hypothetical protein
MPTTILKIPSAPLSQGWSASDPFPGNSVTIGGAGRNPWKSISSGWSSSR